MGEKPRLIDPPDQSTRPDILTDKWKSRQKTGFLSDQWRQPKSGLLAKSELPHPLTQHSSHEEISAVIIARTLGIEPQKPDGSIKTLEDVLREHDRQDIDDIYRE